MSSETKFLYQSEPVFHLNIPDPPGFTANFVYRYYEPGESGDRTQSWFKRLYDENPNNRKYNIYGSPRYIDIKFDSAVADQSTGPNSTEVVGEIKSRYIENLKVGTNVFSEASIQKTGFVRRDPTTVDLNQVLKTSIDNPVKSTFDNFLSVSSNPSSDLNISLLEAALESDVPEIEPSTGQIKTVSYNSIVDNGLCININDDFIYDASKTSFNKINPYHQKQIVDKKALATKQKLARLLNDAEYIDLSEGFPTTINALENKEEKIQELRDIGMVDGAFYCLGFLIFKYRISGNSRVLQRTFVLTESEYRDFNVAYGDKYLYSVHNLYVTISDDFSSPGLGEGSKSLYAFYSNDNRQLIVDCREFRQPFPPTGLRFEIIDNLMSLSWSPVENISNSDGIGRADRIPVGDVKGYQVFSRESVEQPFELIKWITFGDNVTLPIENLPDTLRIKSDRPLERIMVELPRDITKIYSVVAVDAHGNSSGYSSQHSVSYNTRNNEFETELISKSGAPKGYPNMFLGQGKLFKDSIKSSDFSTLEIVYNPDISGLVTPSNVTPKYVLQLFDVFGGESQEIDIIIRES